MHFGKTKWYFYLRDIYSHPSVGLLGLLKWYGDLDNFKMLGQLLYCPCSNTAKWGKVTHSS